MKNLKKCNICLVEKILDDFPKGRACCKICYREKNKIKAREYRKEHPNKAKEIQKRYYKKKFGGLTKDRGLLRTDVGKTCGKCKNFCEWNAFYKDKAIKDGHSSVCIECRKEIKRKYLNSNKGKITENNYRIIHKKEILAAGRRYAARNREALKEYKKERYSAEDRKKWRAKYDLKKNTPGTYVIFEGKKAEVLSSVNGAIRIAIIMTRKQFITSKSKLKLWKSSLPY